MPSAFDGHPEAWFTPGQQLTGPAFSTNVFEYPNQQEPATLWFHDHTMGIARLNVHAGLAAFYLIRDQYDTGIAGTGLNLPAGNYEIEMVIQDRQFDTNGQLLFPDGHPEGLNGSPPNPGIHPFWIPEFFGDAMVVNGRTWPYLRVEPRRYRFRLLNGSNARFLELRLVEPSSDQPGVNAGEKMHRRAGVKMHHGRTGAGADARHSFKQRHPELSFPVRSMSHASRADGGRRGCAALVQAASPRTQLSSSIDEPAFPSRPGITLATARNVGDGRSGATRSTASMASTGPSPQ